MTTQELTVPVTTNLAFILEQTGGLPKIKQPFEQAIFLLDTQIAGLSYIDGVQELLDCLHVGEHLELVREPDNTFDSQAIRIVTDDGDFLGYISMADNNVVSRLMDAGKALYAEVIDRKTSTGEFLGRWQRYARIRVFMED